MNDIVLANIELNCIYKRMLKIPKSMIVPLIPTKANFMKRSLSSFVIGIDVIALVSP